MVDLKSLFKNGNAVTRLIFINVAVFLVIKLVAIFLQLFNVPHISLITYLALPASLHVLPLRFWTLLTYMFLHEGVFHLFFNMLCLYWFGKIALMYLSEKQFVGVYLVGGLVAGLFYLLAYNLFPYYEPLVDASLLVGASGAIMAIIVATAMLAPNMEVMLMFLGRIKLKWLALVTVLISLFGITSSNGGGELAHVGGALAGYIFVVLLRRGTDVSTYVSRIIDKIVNLFKRPKRKKQPKFHYSKPMNDGEYNQYKARKNAEIDAILDKIKRSGYDSLSAEEKRKLFEK